MKAKLTIGLLIMVLIGYITSPIAAAQSGECIELTAAIPENEIPQAGPVGVFFEREVAINVPPDPGWRLMLAGGCTGNPGLKVDDQAVIRNLIADQEWSWDFRSADRRKIEPVDEPVDLTFLVNPRASTISLALSLIDVSPPAHSSSSLAVYWVYDPAAPANPPQAVGVNPPTSIAPPTLTPVPSPTRLPTPIATITVIVAVDPPSAEPDNSREGEGQSGLFNLGWLTLGVISLLVGGGVIWALIQGLMARIPGEMDIYEHDRFWKTISFGQFRKNKLTFGSGPGVDVALSGDDVPAMAARIKLQRGPQGQRQILWEVLDPDHPQEVLEQQLLENEDALFLGSYKLVYRCHQIEPSFIEGGLTNV